MSGDKGCNKRVVVFFGMVASGKSTLAKLWAARHGYPYGNTDVLRKQLGRAMSQELLYSPEQSRRTYQALADFAIAALRDAETVVLDGSYQLRRERDGLRARCRGVAKVVFILCSCGEEAVKRRLAKRALDPTSVSDGNWQVYCRQKGGTFEPPRELPREQLLRVASEGEVEQLAAGLDTLLGQGEGGGEMVRPDGDGAVAQ